MAGWGQNVVNSNFNADTYMAKADNMRGVTKKQTSSAYNNYKVVGINANKISDMIKEMENYISNVNKEINKMKTSANSNQAFKGDELKKALNAYLIKVENYLKNVVTQIRAFEDKLIDVRDAWTKAQSNQANAVKRAGNSFESLGAYQRQKQ